MILDLLDMFHEFDLKALNEDFIDVEGKIAHLQFINRNLNSMCFRQCR